MASIDPTKLIKALVTDATATAVGGVGTTTIVNSYQSGMSKEEQEQASKDVLISSLGLTSIILGGVTNQLENLTQINPAALKMAGASVGVLSAGVGLWSLSNDYQKAINEIQTTGGLSASQGLAIVADLATLTAGVATVLSATPAAPIAAPIAVAANILAIGATAASTIASNPEAMAKIQPTLDEISNVLNDLSHNSTDFINDILNNLGENVLELGMDINKILDDLSKNISDIFDKITDLAIHDGISDLIDDFFDKLALELPDLFPDWAKDLADKTYRVEYYDPLALDLNGDGVITTLADVC